MKTDELRSQSASTPSGSLYHFGRSHLCGQCAQERAIIKEIARSAAIAFGKCGVQTEESRWIHALLHAKRTEQLDRFGFLLKKDFMVFFARSVSVSQRDSPG